MPAIPAASGRLPVCALEGCGAPITRHGGGGRPRLYCSDAHKAAARRRRVSGRPESRSERPLADVRRLLLEAVACLEEATRSGDVHQDAVLAAARAQVTEELLGAQQLAADATRRAADLEQQLRHERSAWVEVQRALGEQRSRDQETIVELQGALDGARSELEDELVRHHHDVEAAQGRLEAHMASYAEETNQLRKLRTAAEAAAAAETTAREKAERRATAAERQLVKARDAVTQLQARIARAAGKAAPSPKRNDRSVPAKRTRTAAAGHLVAEDA